MDFITYIIICDNGRKQQIINYCQDKLPGNKWDLDVLDMICNHFKDIDLNNCTYEEE